MEFVLSYLCSQILQILYLDDVEIFYFCRSSAVFNAFLSGIPFVSILLLLLLLSYHKHLRIISDALESRMKGVRVSHCVCSYSWLWWVGWGQGWR